MLVSISGRLSWTRPAPAHGDDHPDTLRAQHRLAHAYRAARRFDEALRRFRRAADDSARIHGAEHPETLRYRSSLANCHYAAGHTELAIKLFGELFEARRLALGESHPDTLRSRGSLANALHSVPAVTTRRRPCTAATPTTGRTRWGRSTRPPRPAGGICRER